MNSTSLFSTALSCGVDTENGIRLLPFTSTWMYFLENKMKIYILFKMTNMIPPTHFIPKKGRNANQIRLLLLLLIILKTILNITISLVDIVNISAVY